MDDDFFDGTLSEGLACQFAGLDFLTNQFAGGLYLIFRGFHNYVTDCLSNAMKCHIFLNGSILPDVKFHD